MECVRSYLPTEQWNKEVIYSKTLIFLLQKVKRTGEAHRKICAVYGTEVVTEHAL